MKNFTKYKKKISISEVRLSFGTELRDGYPYQGQKHQYFVMSKTTKYGSRDPHITTKRFEYIKIC